MARKPQDIFENAVGLQGPAREEYVRSACGADESLRTEVAALLRIHDQAPTFLASPTAGFEDAATILTASHEHEGQVIGRYKLLQPIGEGGFGSVWMAEQREPVKRRVALKIIKLGMDTKQVIARFEAERQALAMMDHPNIAKVLDAGATETGRPYFVMEYIKGVPILEYCDTERLDTKARLDLFTSVCHAIQHAHQKGIIHRDIKPSNVLITMHDGVPVPKVIDFGIAKATNTELTQKTLFTEHRQMIGTPAYMSPEQAEMSGLDIDTRSDIYSLGVLLYELLTGTTPFATEELMSKGFAEMMRIIREVEPHKPSTRLSSLGDTGTRTAQQRHVADPKKLGLILKGDLDWIVMKCLEKDRTRRYETANGLAADIKRHLSDEPVTAGPPSASYKLRKLVKRNRLQVIAGAVIAAALVLGLAGTAWQAKVASAARDAEKTRADQLKQVSDFQAKMLLQVDPTTAGVRLTEDVNRRFAAALEKAKVPEGERAGLADEFRRDWVRVSATDAAAALIDTTILKPAVKAIDEQFKDQPLVDAQLRVALAERYNGLGLYDAALPLLDSALKTRRRELGDDHPTTLESIDNMGGLLQAQGKLAEAEPYSREAYERCWRVLEEDHEGRVASAGNMGLLLKAQGKYAEAEVYTRQALETSRRVPGRPSLIAACLGALGDVLVAQGKHAEAEPCFREALEVDRSATTLNNVAFSHSVQGQHAKAEPYYREALEMARRQNGEEHPGTLTFINNLGPCLQDQGKLDEAEPYFREAMEKRRRVLGEDHPLTIQSIFNMGHLLRMQGKLSQAEPYYREALERRRRALGDEHPDTVGNLVTVGATLMELGRNGEAEPYIRELREKGGPVLGEMHQQFLLSFNSLGTMLLPQGRNAEAEAFLAEGVAACQRAFTGPHPTTALLLHHHAEALRALGRLEEARIEAQRAHEMYRDHPEWGPEAMHAAGVLAIILSAQGKLDETIAVLREMLKVHRPSLPPGNGPMLTSSLATLGLALLQRGTLEDAREAEPVLRDCVDIRLKIMPKVWLVPNSKSLLGGAILAIADLGPALSADERLERLREAEPLLLDGYAGLKDNPAVPKPAQTGGFDRPREALERIVHLYEVWDKAEPGKGYDAKAAEWKAKLSSEAPPEKKEGNK